MAKKNRVRSKIDDLPEEVKSKVDEMVADTKYTYAEISLWLKDKGYEISKSSVGRYALRTNNATQRLTEAQEQTKALIEVIKKNPDIDYTEPGLQLLASELTKKIAQAEEEFDNMPLDKAGRLIVSLSRTKAYKDKVKQDMQEKVDLAFEKLEEDIFKTIKEDPELVDRMKSILEEAKARMINDDEY